MMNRICNFIARHLPLRVIDVDDEPYLLRFYIAGRAPLQLWPHGTKAVMEWLPFTVYLHGFVQPDGDRALHNHPWSRAFSIVLSGGYDEERRQGVRGDFSIRRLYPGWINSIGCDTFHRIDRLHPGRDGLVWTLFFTGRKSSTWGFLNEETSEVVPWHKYVARKERSQS